MQKLPESEGWPTDINTPCLAEKPRQWSRRRLLAFGCLAAAANLGPLPVLAHGCRSEAAEKTLTFYNPHTGENLQTTYCIEGTYLSEGLAEVNQIFRDHRTDEIRSIDPALLDLLFAIQRRLEARHPFHIVSGYRSPATNCMLRRRHKGVARHSLHMQGKAVDIHLPGHKLTALRRIAVALRMGGVGYYPRSHFVHVDTGESRYWSS